MKPGFQMIALICCVLASLNCSSSAESKSHQTETRAFVDGHEAMQLRVVAVEPPSATPWENPMEVLLGTDDKRFEKIRTRSEYAQAEMSLEPWQIIANLKYASRVLNPDIKGRRRWVVCAEPLVITISGTSEDNLNEFAEVHLIDSADLNTPVEIVLEYPVEVRPRRGRGVWPEGPAINQLQVEVHDMRDGITLQEVVSAIDGEVLVSSLADTTRAEAVWWPKQPLAR